MCHFAVSWEAALGPCVYSDESRRCDCERLRNSLFGELPSRTQALPSEICACEAMLTYKTCCKLKRRRHHLLKANKQKTTLLQNPRLNPGELFNAVLPQ